MKTTKILSLLFIATIALSCSKSDTPTPPPPTNEEEVITTLKVTLTNGANSIVLQSKDLDGDGPNLPVITKTGNILAGLVYVGKVEFLNEAVNPVSDITTEILTEAKDHQVFYTKGAASIGSFTYSDTDANGKPLGLKFSYTAGAANATSVLLKVTLRHLPNKSAANVSTGDITNAGGTTDAEAIFPITIQ